MSSQLTPDRLQQALETLQAANQRQAAVLARYKGMQAYVQRALNQQEDQGLYTTLPEGIVNIFGFERSAVFTLNDVQDTLTLLSGCDWPSQADTLPVERDWLARPALSIYEAQQALWEPSSSDTPWHALGFDEVLFMPWFNEKRGLQGILVGTCMAEPLPDEMERQALAEQFGQYVKQMTDICNTRVALRTTRKALGTKSNFLTNLSHEIRTPMNAIMGMAQIAVRTNDAKSIRHCVDQIQISSRHLLSLINDVLDISKIEEGKLIVKQDAFDLKSIVDGLVHKSQNNITSKRQTLSVRMQGLPHTRFIGDPVRLSQVLDNLLGNAIKFTPADGKIELAIQSMKTSPDKLFLKFTVTDNGIGISPEFRARMFQPYEQAESGATRRHGGIGLGLAISRRIVEMMGGHIEAESVPGQGSSFSFAIWLATDHYEAQRQTIIAQLDWSNRRLMVVDDIPINREIIDAFLRETGIAIEYAENGHEALRMFMKSKPNYYDIIFMDVQMPIMDGLAATRAIRESKRPDAKSTPIWAMTANVFKEDIQQVVVAGMDGHIGKPVEFDEVLKTLVMVLGNKQ